MAYKSQITDVTTPPNKGADAVANAYRKMGSRRPGSEDNLGDDISRSHDEVAAGKEEKQLDELHADDKAVIIGIGLALFGSGLIGYLEDAAWLGSLMVLGGLAMLVPVTPMLRRRAKWLSGRAAIWTLGANALLLIGNLGWLVLHHTASTTQQRIQAWEPLTENQKAQLGLVVDALPKRQAFQVICLHPECRALANDFMQVLDKADWAPTLPGSTFFSEPYGAVLYQIDVNDQRLKNAIEKTTNIKITRIVATTMPPTESLFLGVRP